MIRCVLLAACTMLATARVLPVQPLSEPMPGSCMTNNGGCDANAICSNVMARAGHISCQCDTGFSGDGRNCTFFNYCHESNGGCHPKATCLMSKRTMSRSCICPDGWTGDGINRCDPVDLCATNKHTCDSNAHCVFESHMKYTCECNALYQSQSSNKSEVGHIGDCEKICVGNCAGAGKCVQGKCICNEGFKGEDCSSSLCPSQCSGHGACTKYGCLCMSGFEGRACDITVNYPVTCKTVCKGDCLTKCARKYARSGWGYDVQDGE